MANKTSAWIECKTVWEHDRVEESDPDPSLDPDPDLGDAASGDEEDENDESDEDEDDESTVAASKIARCIYASSMAWRLKLDVHGALAKLLLLQSRLPQR